jgi:hypothetical protein
MAAVYRMGPMLTRLPNCLSVFSWSCTSRALDLLSSERYTRYGKSDEQPGTTRRGQSGSCYDFYHRQGG